MKIGITGANGFIGSHLVKRLSHGKIPYEIFDSTKHDLLKPETLKDFVSTCDTIIHLAAKNRDTNANIINTNTLGTAGLLEAITTYSPKKKIIFLSSFQVYSNSLYGLSKKLAEEIIEFYSKDKGLNAIILRASNVYGPGCKPFYNSVIATFVHLIKKHETLKVNGDGSQKRDYIYVDDVVEAILKAQQTKQKGKIQCFDICSGKLTTLREIIMTLEKISGKKIEVEFKTAAAREEKMEERNFKDAKEHLSWSPKIELEEGLRKTLI